MMPVQPNNLAYNPQGDMSIYEIYSQMYGGLSSTYTGPSISPKLPMDELFLINNAIILDKFECTNGIVYIIDSYPQYYDKSLYLLAKDNSVAGLAPNINLWINRADQSFQRGDDLSFDQTESFANIERVDNLCVERQQVRARGIDLINAVQDALSTRDIVEHSNRAR